MAKPDRVDVLVGFPATAWMTAGAVLMFAGSTGPGVVAVVAGAVLMFAYTLLTLRFLHRGQRQIERILAELHRGDEP